MTDDIQTVLARPETTYWLREAIKSALLRDPLDALLDAETLVALLQSRIEGQAVAPPHWL